MCVGAIVHARIGTLIYGAPEPKTGAVRSTMKLIDDPSWNHRVTVIAGLMAEECRALLQQFFQNRRTENERAKRQMTRYLLIAAFVACIPTQALAQTVDAARIRSAFLKLIDRPRVPLRPRRSPGRTRGSTPPSDSRSRPRPASVCRESS